MLATLAILGGLLGVLAGRAILRRVGPHPTEERCAAMLARYAEQQVRAADLSERPSPRASPAPDGGLRKASPADVTRCAHDLTADEVECAMRSNNADELERCLP